MIDELSNNLDIELSMVRELALFVDGLQANDLIEKKLYAGVINSLKKRIIFVNNSVPEILNGISLAKKLPESKGKEKKVEAVKIDKNKTIFVKGNDKENFVKELNISEKFIKRIREHKAEKDKTPHEFKSTNWYGRLANSLFLQLAEQWIKKGYFKSLSLDLRRSNMNILTTTYVSMLFLTICLAAVLGILAVPFLVIFSLSIDPPYILLNSGNYLASFGKWFWVAFAIPMITAVLFYFYPATEKKSLEKRINQELPFVVIHMSSISGSGIEPNEIFKIIGLSKEYKYVGTEIRKILNQTNIYGYDLSTALRNVAMATPSTKLAELFNGISVTTNSGGDLKSFFEKRSESLLFDYGLEREKFTKLAESFMDIYISMVIAAPMILMMLLIMISVSGLQSGLGITEMTIGIIMIVAFINFLFLLFLKMKQPSY